MQAWIGYQQSLRPCESGLTLNVDLACTAFIQEQPVPKFLAEAAGVLSEHELANLGDVGLKKVKRAIEGLKVCQQPARSPVLLISGEAAHTWL